MLRGMIACVRVHQGPIWELPELAVLRVIFILINIMAVVNLLTGCILEFQKISRTDDRNENMHNLSILG
jgi:hypothetical protein